MAGGCVNSSIVRVVQRYLWIAPYHGDEQHVLDTPIQALSGETVMAMSHLC
jgi:hypothetical protein